MAVPSGWSESSNRSNASNDSPALSPVAGPEQTDETVTTTSQSQSSGESMVSIPSMVDPRGRLVREISVCVNSDDLILVGEDMAPHYGDECPTNVQRIISHINVIDTDIISQDAPAIPGHKVVVDLTEESETESLENSLRKRYACLAKVGPILNHVAVLMYTKAYPWVRFQCKMETGDASRLEVGSMIHSLILRWRSSFASWHWFLGR